MACFIERRRKIEIMIPVGGILTPSGVWTSTTGPCRRKSAGEDQPCKDCLTGRWGDHDKITKRGAKQLSAWKEQNR